MVTFRRRRETEEGKLDARALVSNALSELQTKTYDELVAKIDEPDHRWIDDLHGRPALLEVEVFWDAKPNETIRVFASVVRPLRVVTIGAIAQGDFLVERP